MKKISCLIVALIMTFVLLGCSSMSNQVNDMKESLKEQADIIDAIEKERSELLDGLDDLYARLENLTIALDVFFNEVEDLSQSNAELLDELSQVENEIIRMENEIKRVEQERAQKQEQLESFLSAMSVEKIDDYHDASNTEVMPGEKPIVACGYRYLKYNYEIDNVYIYFYCGYDSALANPSLEGLDVIIESGAIYSDEIANPDDLEPSFRLHDCYIVENFYKTEKYALKTQKIESLNELGCYMMLEIPQLFFDYQKGFIRIKAGDNHMMVYYKVVSGYVILSSNMFVD